MRYLLIGLFAITILATAPALAKDGEKISGPLKALRNPIDLNYGVSPRMAVIFNHSTHKDIRCVLCHHIEDAEGKLYVPCTNEDCHSIKGARERDPMSMFMAYHDPGSDRSCYGCHKKEAARHPDFRGCRPCHISPMARAAAAGK